MFSSRYQPNFAHSIMYFTIDKSKNMGMKGIFNNLVPTFQWWLERDYSLEVCVRVSVYAWPELYCDDLIRWRWGYEPIWLAETARSHPRWVDGSREVKTVVWLAGGPLQTRLGLYRLFCKQLIQCKQSCCTSNVEKGGVS